MNTVAEEFSAIAGTYRRLARLWLGEVDEQFLDSLLQAPLCDAFTSAGGSLPQDASPSTLEELSVDYCQLFLGPARHFPPFQSVWERGQFQGESVQSMKQYFSVAGYETELMADHLGVQLDVMAKILEARPQIPKEADAVVDLAYFYFAAHLTWANPLFESSVDHATTDFYRSVVNMTREFLNSEQTIWRGDVESRV